MNSLQVASESSNYPQLTRAPTTLILMNPNNTRGRLKYQRAELPLAAFNEERGSSIVSLYKLPVEVDTKCFDWTMIPQIPTIRRQ